MYVFHCKQLHNNINFQLSFTLHYENYYDKKIDDEQISKYLAIKCASLLRETMWSMVSEITSKIDFDYKDYTHQNLSKFNDEFKKLKS